MTNMLYNRLTEQIARQFVIMFCLPTAPDALPPQRALRHYLQIQRFGFATIGIDPTSLERTVYNYFLAWFPMLCILTLIVPITMYALKHVNSNMDETASALSPMWQGLLSIVKFFLFMWNKKKIVRLVRKVWLWSLKANDRELQILADELYYDHLVSVFYYSSVYVTGTLAVVAPLVIAAVYAFQGYGFWASLEEPLKAEYTRIVDIENSALAYILCFLWNVVGIYYIMNGTLAIDSLFSWFMRNLSAQFRILNLRFQLVAENTITLKAEGFYSDKEFAKSLIECVNYHRRVIKMTESFSDIYKEIVFIKFLISCLQLACLSFQIPHGGEIATQLFNISFLLAVTTQQMLYCYGGQRIKDMSSSVNLAIYQYFQWNDLSLKSQKLLLLPMMRSQKPCDVRGIFFVVDLSLFLWVYKTAASFMTMMLSVEQRET